MTNKNKKCTLSTVANNSKNNLYKHGFTILRRSSGFTIVELLVVIVVIGILATITIVSYTGISQRAKVASLQSDLSNASTQIKVFQATDASGNYPTANVCPTPGATEICLKASNDNTYTYASNNAANPKVFALNATNGTTVYQITNNSAPTTPPVSLLAIADPTNWQTIGTQTWAKFNLNVGTRIAGASNQTNNATLEKYCYSDTESSCTTYGGLYQWDEAMQYTNANGAQGICPTGSHIPTDAEWTTLETYLGSATAATQLMTGGTSGINMPIAGYRTTGGTFTSLLAASYFWSSLESSSRAWVRQFYSGQSTIGHLTDVKTYGYSVRCIGN